MLLSQFGNWLLLAGVLLFALAGFNAIRASRQARGAAYYGIRQQALSKTRRWTLVAALAFVLTGALAFYMDQQPRAAAIGITLAATPTPMLVDIPSKMLPTDTPQPVEITQISASPTVPPSPTQRPSATPTVTPTATLPPDLPNILQTPLPGAATPASNAVLTFTTLASVTDSKGNPTDPGLAFPAGTRRVRLYFQAANVNNGAMYSVLCYKDKHLVDSVVDLWEWGSRPQNARAFCNLDGSPGKYRVFAYLGSTPQFEIAYELLPAPKP